MPHNWKTYKLGELSKIGDGAHSKVKRGKEGVLYLTSKNFKHGKLALEKIDYISESDYNRLFSSDSKAVNKPQVGDIMLGIIGTLGNAYLFREADKFGISSSVAIIRPDDKKILPQYLYYFITGPEFKHFQNAHNGASVQGYTNIPSLKSIPVSYPESLQEQRSIASILSALDDKIELNLAMNRTLEDMAMTLYKHWFVDFGPFQHQEFIDSELGMIPKGWEVKGILDVADLLSGGTPKTTIEEYWNGDISWVSAKDIGNGVLYINQTEKTITELGVKNSSTKILPEDTVILVARGSVGKYGMIAKPMAMNQSCYGLYSKGLYSQGMVYLMFSLLIEQFQRMSYGSVFDTITTSTFNSAKVILAPNNVVEDFRPLVDSYFNQLKKLTLENQTLTALRDTLLPKLISGEVRVKEAEQMVNQSLD